MAKNKTKDGACRVCGCTNDSACYDPVTGSCWWVKEDLCSACATPVQIKTAIEGIKKLVKLNRVKP